jgi:hypothetical protein
VTPGDGDDSLLVRAIRYDDDLSPMPPDQKLDDAVVAHFVDWIRHGAPAPSGQSTDQMQSQAAHLDDAEPASNQHWAFLPPHAAKFVSIDPQIDPPIDRQRTRMDRIVRQRQAEFGLVPTEEATSATLVRRLYYDLTGLPPRYDDETEKVWAAAEELQLPRIVVLNRLDRDRASLDRSLQSLRESCGRTVIPIQLPIGEEKGFRGVVDLVSRKAFTYQSDESGKFTEGAVPGEMAAAVESAREALIEMVAEADEQLM